MPPLCGLLQELAAARRLSGGYHVDHDHYHGSSSSQSYHDGFAELKLWGSVFNDEERASLVRMDFEKLRFGITDRGSELSVNDQVTLERLSSTVPDPYELYYKDGTLVQEEFSGCAAFWRHSAVLQDEQALAMACEAGKYEVSDGEGNETASKVSGLKDAVTRPSNLDDSLESIKAALRYMGMRDDDPFLLAEIQQKRAAREAVYQEELRKAAEKAREAELRLQQAEERKAQWLSRRGKGSAGNGAAENGANPPPSTGGVGSKPPLPPPPASSSKVHKDRDYSAVPPPPPTTALPPPPPGAAPTRPKSPPKPAVPAPPAVKTAAPIASSKAPRDRDYGGTGAQLTGVAPPPPRTQPPQAPPGPATQAPTQAPPPAAAAASSKAVKDSDYGGTFANTQATTSSSAAPKTSIDRPPATAAKAPKDRDYSAVAGGSDKISRPAETKEGKLNGAAQGPSRGRSRSRSRDLKVAAAAAGAVQGKVGPAAASVAKALPGVGEKRHRSQSRDRDRPSAKAPAVNSTASGAARRGDSRDRRQFGRDSRDRGGDHRGGQGQGSSGRYYETDEFGRERVSSGAYDDERGGGGGGRSDSRGRGPAGASNYPSRDYDSYHRGGDRPGERGGGGGGYRRN